MSGSLEINSVLSLTYNRLYIVLFCLMVFALRLSVLRNTNLQVRGVTESGNGAGNGRVRRGLMH